MTIAGECWGLEAGAVFWKLSSGQRFIYLALAAYAAQEEPRTMIGDVSVRTLAQWAQVSTGAMHAAIKEMLEQGLLKRDDRRSEPVLEFVGRGVQNLNTTLPGVQILNSNNECSESERPAPAPQASLDQPPSLFPHDAACCSESERQLPNETNKRVVKSLSRTAVDDVPAPRKGTSTKKKITARQATLEEAEMIADLTPTEQYLLEEFLEVLASHPRGKAKSPIGRRNRVQDLLQIRDAFGSDAWQHGLRAASGAEAHSVGYVRVVAEDYDPAKHNRRGNDNRGGEGRIISDREWEDHMLRRQNLIAQGLDPDATEEGPDGD